jgi:hypothetical protein
LVLDWRIRSGGLPDLVAVPRAAVRAASTRGLESRIGVGWTGRLGPARDWAGAAANAGWDPHGVARVAAAAAAPPTPAPSRTGSLETRVASRLLTKGSTFNKRDAVVALAASSQHGFDSEAASSWADAFCREAIPVASSSTEARWTTPVALEADRRLAELINRRMDRRLPETRGIEAELQRDSTLSPESRAAALALAGNGAVDVLVASAGCSNFVSSASVLGLCASVWEEQGMRVAVATRAEADASRWHALSGVSRFDPSKRPDVLLVDQADRRPPGDLMAVLSAAPDAKVVFIEGGTLPRARVESSRGYEMAASGLSRLDPGPAPEWRILESVTPGSWSTAAAVSDLLGRWADGGGIAGRADPVMVGLGAPETLALNDAARRHLASIGRLAGPTIEAWGRPFQAGDKVVAIRSAGAGLPSGTVGTVVEIDPKNRSATISWPDRATHMTRESLRSVGHAYAATPRLASRMEGPVFVLGRAEGLGLERSRVAAEISVAALDLERPRALVREL